MLIIYPLGIPLYFAFEIHRNRNAIRGEGIASRVGRVSSIFNLWQKEDRNSQLEGIAFLYEPYRKSRFTLYAEVIDVYRRLILSSLVVFSGQNAVTRSLWGSLIAGFWVQIFSMYEPFISVRTNFFAHMGNLTILSTYIIRFFLEIGIFKSNSSVVGFGIFFINLAIIALFFAQRVQHAADPEDMVDPDNLKFDPSKTTISGGLDVSMDEESIEMVHFSSMSTSEQAEKSGTETSPDFNEETQKESSGLHSRNEPSYFFRMSKLITQSSMKHISTREESKSSFSENVTTVHQTNI
jgi:hypothetical protein